MIGLMVLGFWALYLALSIGLAKFVISRRRNSGDAKAKWWGVGVFVLMWVLVIQDYPLMEWEYQRLCKTEGGFRQYKTVEQWQQENPGVWETLEPIENAETIDVGKNFYVQMNQRFRYGNEKATMRFGIRKLTTIIQDIETGEVIATNTDFNSGDYFPGSTNDFLFFWRNHSGCFRPLPRYDVNYLSQPSVRFGLTTKLFENGNQGEQQ